jgi:hypothetical protein
MVYPSLPDYVDYRFKQKITTEQTERIKDKLLSLKNSSVDLDDHPGVIDRVLQNDLTVLSNNRFYHEIDERIAYAL